MVQESRHGRVTIDQKEPEISTDVMVSSFSGVDHDMLGRKITFETITVLVNSRNPIIIDLHFNRNGMGNDSAMQISDVTYGTVLGSSASYFLKSYIKNTLKSIAKAKYKKKNTSKKNLLPQKDTT